MSRFTGYYPEMGEAKPVCDIEASLSYYGRHYYLETELELKGRGVNYIKTYTSNELTPAGQYKVGRNQYKVTELAFDRICKQHSVSYEMLLD